MKYLLTGATGGLGGLVHAALTKAGHEVVTWSFRDDMPGGVYEGIIHLAGHELLSPLKFGSREKATEAFLPVYMLVDILAGAAGGVVRNGGSIIAMSSVAAVCGTSGMSLYSASKGAIEAMVRSAAIELAPRDIRVNCVRAGGFTGPMNDRIRERVGNEAYAAYDDRHPLGIGPVDQVVRAILFLLENTWTSGTALVVDGGYSAQ